MKSRLFAVAFATAALFGCDTGLKAWHLKAHADDSARQKDLIMPELESAVRNEIEEMHRFFVGWFTGEVSKDALETYFAPRMHADMHIIPPSGEIIDRSALLDIFRQTHGNNPLSRIAIRNVHILYENETHVLASYEEWQRDGTESKSGTGRLSSVLMTKAQPLEWIHVHETWLPEETIKKGPFDF